MNLPFGRYATITEIRVVNDLMIEIVNGPECFPTIRKIPFLSEIMNRLVGQGLCVSDEGYLMLEACRLDVCRLD